jgi:2-oxoisovalerate dehydrogenase E1 component
MVPVSAGFAYSQKKKNPEAITVVFIGDGTLGEGVIYETMNICSLWNVPLLIVLENNGFAQSTSFMQTFSGSVKDRVQGFGIRYASSNVWDIESLIRHLKESTEFVRQQGKPCFIEIETYRLNSHSKSDDNRIRKEIDDYYKKDLITIYQNENNVSDELSEIQEIINEAVDFAEKGKGKNNIDSNKEIQNTIEYSPFTSVKPETRINDAIYEALKTELTDNDNCILIGEDIEYVTKWAPLPYGGAFKVTKDLSDLFKNKVKNTPISEAAITGIGTGMALGGMRPVVEIMFGDFITLIFDQVMQHACKFRSMYNGQVSVPLVIRTPMGGRRGYGPTHSQSIEKFFIGIPGLYVIALNARISPQELYKSIFSQKDPVLVIENKLLYTRFLNNKEITGFTITVSDEEFPTIKISPADKKPGLTIFCYGEMLDEVEKAIEMAFDEDEILCEVICPSLINPLNKHIVMDSVKRTGKLLTIEEGPSIAGVGAEIISLLLENGVQMDYCSRMGNNYVIPCAIAAEKNIIPNANSIYKEVKKSLV